MPEIIKTTSCPYSCQQIFDLVADINAYKDFVPACRDSRILSRQGKDACRAHLIFKKWGIRAEFTTNNTYLPYERITMQLVEGKGLHHLSGAWQFTENPSGCIIRLHCEYEIAYLSPLTKLVDGVWGLVFKRILGRAEHLYGD